MQSHESDTRPVGLPVNTRPDDAAATVGRYIDSLYDRLLYGRRRPGRTVLVWLPWWSHAYERRSSEHGPIRGVIAVETRYRATALVPEGVTAEPLPDDALRLPAGSPPDEVAAHRAVWDGALIGRRKPRDLEIELAPATRLYLPYWAVHLEARQSDLMVVDATDGRHDLRQRASVKEGLAAIGRF